MEQLGRLETLVQWAPPVPKETLESKDHLVRKVNKVLPAILAQQASEVLMVHLVIKALLVRLAPTVSKVRLEKPEFKVQLEKSDLLVRMGKQEQTVKLDL
jgi:hypothetical protein